jgi:hypothetical protein
MNIDSIKEMLDRFEIFYRFDETLNLWLISLDDVIIYLLQKDLEELSLKEFEVYFSSKVVVAAATQSEKIPSIH